MPYQVVEEYCGRWWHFFWAGPLLYVHLVDIPDLSPSYCEVAQPTSLLNHSKYSIPVACVPLVYRAGEQRWAASGVRGFFRRTDKLAEALEEAAQRWPYWCSWTPAGRVPPSVYDVGLLAEALEKMPIYDPPPEDLAIDYVNWSYPYLPDFLDSEFVHVVRGPNAEFVARWREICEHEDPRQCYPGALGEKLSLIKRHKLVPGLDGMLFGKTFLQRRPWGIPPSYLKRDGGLMIVYYALGHVLRGVFERRRAVEAFNNII